MPAKVVMTLLMLAGEIAACLVVFGYNENVPQRALAAVDMVVGIIICLWLWLPNFPLNPDAPPRQGAG